MHEIISPNDAMDFKLDFSVDSGSVVNKHYHDWLEIVYLLKGTLEVEENNEQRLDVYKRQVLGGQCDGLGQEGVLCVGILGAGVLEFQEK